MIDQGFVKRVAICEILIIFAEWSADGILLCRYDLIPTAI